MSDKRAECCHKTVFRHCDGCPYVPVEKCECATCTKASKTAPAAQEGEMNLRIRGGFPMVKASIIVDGVDEEADDQEIIARVKPLLASDGVSIIDVLDVDEDDQGNNYAVLLLEGRLDSLTGLFARIIKATNTASAQEGAKDELVERLERYRGDPITHDAAARIEVLQARVAELEAERDAHVRASANAMKQAAKAVWEKRTAEQRVKVLEYDNLRLRGVLKEAVPFVALHQSLAARSMAADMRAALASAPEAGATGAWQPIETAPRGEEVQLYQPAHKSGRQVLPARIIIERVPFTGVRKPTLWKRVEWPTAPSDPTTEQREG